MMESVHLSFTTSAVASLTKKETEERKGGKWRAFQREKEEWRVEKKEERNKLNILDQKEGKWEMGNGKWLKWLMLPVGRGGYEPLANAIFSPVFFRCSSRERRTGTGG